MHLADSSTHNKTHNRNNFGREAALKKIERWDFFAGSSTKSKSTWFFSSEDATRVLHERHSRSSRELRKRDRLTDEGNKKGRREMKLATPSLPAKEAPLISQLYSGSRKLAGQS